MSSSYYNQKWYLAIGNLLETIEQENAPLNENRKDKGITYKRNDLYWFQYYGHLYLRYLQCYRDIYTSYDQIVHPQKRVLLKYMLENVMVRMCEVKQNMIRYSTATNIVQSDCINIDEILMELKLTPKELRVPLPRYFCEKTNGRDSIIYEIVKELGITYEVETIVDSVALDTNLETAIRIIQKLERGRQGIVRAQNFAKIKNRNMKDRSPDASNYYDKRTTVIQKYWRAFLARKYLHRLREEELKFLGIQKTPIDQNILAMAYAQRTKIKEQQLNNAVKFESYKAGIVYQIKKTYELTIKQKMLDDRRQWIKKFMEIHEFYNVPTKAADYYKDKQAYSYEIQSYAKYPAKKEAKDKKGDAKSKPKKNYVYKYLYDHIAIGPTEAVVKLEDTIKTYSSTWGSRDETDVSEEIYDAELARDELRPNIYQYLYKIVDNVIGLYLDGMRVKYGIKKQKYKKAKKVKPKVKKVKIPQGLGKRAPRYLLTELFERNIAKVLSPAKLTDFIGYHNTITHLLYKNAYLMPDPSLAQVRNIVTEYVGIPLGCQLAKDKLEKWNWFLFYGGMGTGKTLMLRALQHETNSVLFDLTPDSVKYRYTEKAELTKLIWSVIICAKYFQPSIIMIDDFYTIFSGVKGKKKDSNSSFGPKMKKIISDMKKNKLWDSNDRISIIACSNRPYDGSMKDMKKLFDKTIYFPFPNYVTRKHMIRHFIEGKAYYYLNYFSYETMTHISEGFTAGSFKQCIEKVMTPLRLARLNEDPLRLSEFVNPLANSLCVFAYEYEKLKKFTDEITGLKERRYSKKEPPASEGKKTDKKYSKGKKAK